MSFLQKTSLKVFSHYRRATSFNTLRSKADSLERSFVCQKKSFSRKAISGQKAIIGQNAISGQKVISVNVNFIAKKLLKITGNRKFIYAPQNFSTLYSTMYTLYIYDLVWWFLNYSGLKFIVQILTYALFIPRNLIHQKW